MSRKKNVARVLLAAVLMIAVFAPISFTADDMEKYVPDTAAADAGMTMWQIIKAGGSTMIVLAFLSIAALSLIVYYFLSMKQEKLLPDAFLDRMITLIEESRISEAKMIAETNQNLIADVLKAGLSRADKGTVMVKEAMEDEGRRGTDALWQRLSYLGDIAAIAPMVGLLGTVLGMIQAFNVIAFQSGAVKPILLASGISKAMVTTAGGLMIAIPAMMFYSYFRGIVQDVSARLENVSTEMYHLIVETAVKDERVKGR
jgi:biopolymer transport protein ExbB